MAYRQLIEKLSKSIAVSELWIVSSMPRGGLQIIQPAHVPETIIKGYSREAHMDDAATWRAIDRKRPFHGDECFSGGLESSRYYDALLKPSQLRYLAVAPLNSPLFEGYHGAIHLYRTAELGDFGPRDLQQLAEAAREIEQAMAESRAARAHHAAEAVWLHHPETRQFIFNAHLQPQLESDLGALDDRIREQILEDAKNRLMNLDGQVVSSVRVALPDSSGDLWIFRAVCYRQYPALGDGPFVFYCLQPDCTEWANLRAADVQADAEVARLIPALQFMHDEFKRGPTLNEIAKTAHLSPFHFHRRFTELMGITPKHLLLECQIFEAKKQLVSGEKDLADIAATCGFAHQSHFTSRFRQTTGLTPTRWRKMALQKHLAASA